MISIEPTVQDIVITTVEPAMPPVPPPIPFVRDRFTWLSYLMLAYFSYLQAALGPLMTFLRTELSMNYTVAAFHLSAYAAGAVISGLTSERVAQRLGRRITFWGGAVGMSVGAALLTIGRSPVATVSASFVTGLFGVQLLVMIQAMLSDKYGSQRAIALTEVNISASASAILAPLLIGLVEVAGIGWRGSLYVGIGVLVLLGVFLLRTPMPASPPAVHVSTRGTLPRIFWLYWLSVMVCVAIEWSVIYWSADFLQKVVGLNPVDASTMVSLFFIAQLVGRVVGSRFAHRMRPTTLLLDALAVTLVGFLMLWLSPFALLNIIGLFIAGLGIANLYPLNLSITTSLAPEQANLASARTSMASGLAILIAPQVLGWVADQITIRYALGIIFGLTVLAVALIFIANRLALRQEAR